MIHPDSELRFVNATIGYGQFATSLIRKGTLTWVRDDLDQIVGPALQARVPPILAELLHKYSYLEPRGRVLCWDHGRFVNHSCEANCRSTGFAFEIAVRDIQPGEEITDDSGSLNVDYEFDCHCHWPRCRGTVIRPGPLRWRGSRFSPNVESRRPGSEPPALILAPQDQTDIVAFLKLLS